MPLFSKLQGSQADSSSQRGSLGRGGGKSGTGGAAGSRAGSRAADQRKTPTPAPSTQPAAGGALPASSATEDDYAVPVREVVKPTRQLQLSAAELEEEVGRTLTSSNPAAPANVVRFSLRERGFRPEPLIDQLLQHVRLEGSLLHRDSEDLARDRRRESVVAAAAALRRETLQSRRATQAAGADHGAAESDLGHEPSSACLLGGPKPKAALQEGDADGRRLRNQFNFTDRGAQTGHAPPRERGTMTQPPPSASAAGSCTSWEMYDAYLQDQERQRAAEEQARQRVQVARKGQQPGGTQLPGGAGGGGGRAGSGVDNQPTGGPAEPLAAPVALHAVKVLERMASQNCFRDVAMDFKYWEDPADAVRGGEGTLLPLWSFNAPRAKGRAVTALSWSPRHPDLFVVGHGSFDFRRPTTGLVSLFSLKNPGHPEASMGTPAGVMCLDFHPDHPALLGVGCYDGSVLVFDVRSGSEQPLYASSPAAGQHAEPVWQLCWQRTDGHELQLHTVSTDGRVALWTISRSELSCSDMLELGLLRGREPPSAGSGDEGEGSVQESGEGEALAGGCCFDFSPHQECLFLVGTEEGTLYKCSTAYASESLQAFHGHHMPVYAVRWNALHGRAFLSASADWSIKLWDSLLQRPVLSFDLGAPAGDVAWAPFGSTVFAAVSEAGRVHVYDLAQSRHAPLCAQKVASKGGLTRLAFNPLHPVLLVGDEHGGVTCLKLSPNLRKGCTPGAAAAAAGTASAAAGTAAGAAAAGAASGAAGTAGGGRAGAPGELARSESQRVAARAAEGARLEAVLQLAGKCNAAMQPDDWDLL